MFRNWSCLPLTVLLFCSWVCPAQTSVLSRSSTVEGKVVNFVTGEPVRRAQVTLRAVGASPETAKTANTDVSGRFIFTNLKAGKYALHAQHSRFLDSAETTETANQPSSMPLVLPAGQTFKGILLRLTPPGVIAGRVLGEDGDPLPNAAVMAIAAGPSTSASGPAAVTRVYSNDMGEYRLHGLTPARYHVSATYRNGKTVYTQTYYPNATVLATASFVEVGAGAELTNIDIVLSRKVTPRSSQVARDGDAAAGSFVKGQVVNTATGEPVTKAEVALDADAKGSDPIPAAITDASGTFTLQDIAPGSYHIHASRNGFLPSEHGMHDGKSSSATISVTAGRTLLGIRLGLAPQGTITGRIFDEDHDPVSNVAVMALRQEAGQRHIALATRAYTNDLGEFRLSALRPGRYYLSAVYRGELSASLGVSQLVEAQPPEGSEGNEEAYVPTYYPHAVRLADAVPLRMMPGGLLAGLDFELSKSHRLRIKGRVLVPGAKVDRNLTLSLTPRDSSVMARFIPHQTVNIEPATGQFELRDVTAGAYVLTADWPHGMQRYRAQTQIDIDKTDLQGITLRLAPLLKVTGQMRMEGQNSFDLSPLTVSLHLRSPQAMASGGRGRVAQDGSFAIANLTREHYAVSVSGLKEDCYLKSVSLGTATLSPSDVDLSRGADGVLELVISPAGGEIDGVVLDEQQQPAAAVTIELIPESPAPGENALDKRVTTDQNGRFTLRGIPPGGYTLIAADDLSPDLYQEPAALAALEKFGKAVTVQENSSTTVQLSLIPAKSQTSAGMWAP